MTRSIDSSSVVSGDRLLAGAGGEQRGLVDDVGEVGAGEAGRAAGDDLQVDVGRRSACPWRAPRGSARRPCMSGRSTAIWRSKRPGRSSAGSRMSGRLVAAMRMTPPLTSKPSISTSIWLSVCSRSSCPPPMPAPRCRPTASISSMKMIAGAFCLGLLEQVADAAGADADEHLDEVRAGDRVERHARLAGDGAGQQRLAGAGRAVQQHALGDLGADGLELGRAPARNSLISWSSSMASSTPATSANVVFGVSLLTSLALDLPNCMTRVPPPCIWFMKKNSRPRMSRNGRKLRAARPGGSRG